MRRALLLAAILLLPGCVKEDPARDVQGRTDGYYPTAAYLKVQLRSDDGHVTLADFNRSEWYVAEIAKRIDERQITQMSAHGNLRLIGEVVVLQVHAPDGLDTLRYDNMHATAQQRSAMDQEYDALIARLGSDDLKLPQAGDATPLPVPFPARTG